MDGEGNPDVNKTNYIIEQAYSKEQLILRDLDMGLGM